MSSTAKPARSPIVQLRVRYTLGRIPLDRYATELRGQVDQLEQRRQRIRRELPARRSPALERRIEDYERASSRALQALGEGRAEAAADELERAERAMREIEAHAGALHAIESAAAALQAVHAQAGDCATLRGLANALDARARAEVIAGQPERGLAIATVVTAELARWSQSDSSGHATSCRTCRTASTRDEPGTARAPEALAAPRQCEAAAAAARQQRAALAVSERWRAIAQLAADASVSAERQLAELSARTAQATHDSSQTKGAI